MNKNPIKFKGETMVEVQTEKSKETLPILITENKNTQPLLGSNLVGQIGNLPTGRQKDGCDPPRRRRPETKENH